MAEADKKKEFTHALQCGHCRNHAPMEIVHRYFQIAPCYDETSHTNWDQGDVYELLLCPACNDVILRSYFWHECAEDAEYQTLYPMGGKVPIGLPDAIKKAYDAALRVRNVDPNAYAVLIGRLLEMVCDDREAKGKKLNDKLFDLATKGEIPAKLVGVAKGIRNLRNVGAHATLGELTAAEIPILDDLTKAILEYVYSAPFLAKMAEDRFARLKRRRKPRPGKPLDKDSP